MVFRGKFATICCPWCAALMRTCSGQHLDLTPSCRDTLIAYDSRVQSIEEGADLWLTTVRVQVMTKKIRHHQLLRYVNQYTSHLWARRIIHSLLQAGQKAREYNRLQKLDTGYLQVCHLTLVDGNKVVSIVGPCENIKMLFIG